MKKTILTTAFIFQLILSGCSVVKTPQISAINKDEGLMNLSYKYDAFEIPKVNMDLTQSTATDQCLKWGFLAASQSEAPITNCIQYNENRSCFLNEVIIRYSCGLTGAQIAAKESKRQEQLKKDQEKQEQLRKDTEEKLLETRTVNVNKTSLCASYSLAMSTLMNQMGNQEMKSKYEGYSLGFAKTSMQIGSSIGLTNKEMIALNKKNTKLVANSIKGKSLTGINELLTDNIRNSCLSFLKSDDEVRSIYQKYMNQ
jgi:hypothetical protein